MVSGETPQRHDQRIDRREPMVSCLSELALDVKRPLLHMGVDREEGQRKQPIKHFAVIGSVPCPVAGLEQKGQASLQGVEVISARRPGGEVGLAFDRRQRSLCAVLRVRLRSFGLLSDADQERRLASFGALQNELAADGSPVQRLMLIKRTVPRSSNELAAYLKEQSGGRMDSPSVRAMFEVIDSGQELAREHEVFVVVQLPVAGLSRSARRRLSEAEQREYAGAQAADQLDQVARHLEAAEITIKSVDGALTPRALARMIKDSFDPFGRLLRDRRGLLGGWCFS
jgi:hypothetical protein